MCAANVINWGGEATVNRVSWETSLWWGSREAGSFLRPFFFFSPPCSSLLQPAAIALCWLSGVQTVMISLPPLPDEPLSAGGRADLTAVS